MPDNTTPARTKTSSSASADAGTSTTSTSTSSVDGRLIKELTDAILKLAERPHVPPKRDELVEERRRVDFGYRSLGVLMGRDPTQHGFNLPVFAARWNEKNEIELFDLPDKVTWVEVTARGFTEEAGEWPPVRKPLRVVRACAGSASRPPRIESDDEVFPRRTIDLLIGLELEDGVGVALGPRLAPVPSIAYHS